MVMVMHVVVQPSLAKTKTANLVPFRSLVTTSHQEIPRRPLPLFLFVTLSTQEGDNLVIFNPSACNLSSFIVPGDLQPTLTLTLEGGRTLTQLQAFNQQLNEKKIEDSRKFACSCCIM
ncbi:hypothetical protein Ancab_039189 [Ancistrocladus abbreviatus]